MTAVAQWSGPLTLAVEPGEGFGDQITREVGQGYKYSLPACADCNFTGRDWYLFVGWAVNGNESDLKQPTDTITISENTVVTAIWDRPEYNVTFDSNGGSEVREQSRLRGTRAIKPDDPTLEGRTFKGWYVDDELFDFETPITGDITLTAMWCGPWGALQKRIDAAAEARPSPWTTI